MARRELINAILQSFQKLGGNLNDVLGTKTNVSFLGKGKSPEMMLDMDINEEALAILPQSKAVEELTSSVGYAVGNKLNDIQANKLLSNMKKMENVYFPPAEPKNITDLATGTRNLDAEGIMTLRRGGDPTKYKPGDPITSENFAATGFAPDNTALRRARELSDDIPPPGSRGGPEDISAPFASAEESIKNLEASSPTGTGLELLKNVKNNNLIINEVVDKIYLNAGVAPAAQPVVRANARDFLNRIKDLTDEPGNPTLSSVMEADDFKFMTEGGGGGMGDPFLLVQKYFGPKVAAAVAKLDTPNDIQLFAERLVSVKDAKGRGVSDRFFDPNTVDIDDFEFADGGRVPFMAGMLVRGGKMGYQALRKYGIEGRDISRLFASLGTDKSLVGKEKTAYFQQLHKVLRNPDAFPDEIMDIQKQLGLDVGLGFRNGGLAGILEV